MTEYVKATITGVFPKEDIELIANYYGGANADDKLAHILMMAKGQLTEFLSAPTKSAIIQEKKNEQNQLIKGLTDRVQQYLEIETEEIAQ